ncbi:MAG: hypothetical protein DRI44_09225 [Chlamydiae bacterium]|nr:MAG: hypothetical protein DRI44_09225 [Chlamydiota bacterium]
MNIKNLKFAIIITLIPLPCFAVKVYQNLNMTGQNITNVPAPIADNHAVNNEYIENLVDELYEGTNLSVAVPAKCADGQIAGYTPIPAEDLYTNMQYGVDWSTNTRFTVDSTDSNVYDNLTGLMWTKDANLHQGNWTNAINYCTSLVYGGYSDWRLPNRKELFSLVDFSKYLPCLPLGHPFSAVQASRYWSSSTRAFDDSGHAWVVYMDIGGAHYFDKTNSYYVWPVRAGR